MSIYLKEGFTVVVVSWENDADNYKTKMMSGLTQEQAIAVYNFCQLFSSKHGHNRGLGNEEIRNLDFEDMSALLSRDDRLYLPIGLNKSLEDLFYELIGDWCEGGYARVVEDVFFLAIEDDIQKLSLKDITFA
jgi:hypothetical protein